MNKKQGFNHKIKEYIIFNDLKKANVFYNYKELKYR